MTAREGRAGLRLDLAQRLRLDDGLARILGTPPPEPEHPRVDHAALVAETASALAVEDGLTAVLTTLSGHAALVAGLPDVLALDRGLAGILGGLDGPVAPAADPHRGPAGSGPPAAGVAGPADGPSIDSLVRIYAADGCDRLVLRAGRRHRHLRTAMDRLAELRELLRRPPGEPGGEAWLTALLERQVDRMALATAVLAGALPAVAVSAEEGEDNRRRSRKGKKTGKPKDVDDPARAATHFQLAVNALERAEFQEARTRFRRAAKLGHADAIVNLAKLWNLGGRGISKALLSAGDPQHRAAAVRLFLDLFSGGNNEAGYFAGELQAFGGDQGAAAAAWERAARGGNRRAAARLRELAGQGVFAAAVAVNRLDAEPAAPPSADREDDAGGPPAVGAVNRVLLADEVTPLLAAVAQDLTDLLGTSSPRGGSAELRSLADRLHRHVEQVWRAVSDFEGADLRAAEVEPGLADLDGVRWSDGAGRQRLTRWPDRLAEAVRRQSEPVEGCRGVWEVAFRDVVGADR